MVGVGGQGRRRRRSKRQDIERKDNDGKIGKEEATVRGNEAGDDINVLGSFTVVHISLQDSLPRRL